MLKQGAATDRRRGSQDATKPGRGAAVGRYAMAALCVGNTAPACLIVYQACFGDGAHPCRLTLLSSNLHLPTNPAGHRAAAHHLHRHVQAHTPAPRCAFSPARTRVADPAGHPRDAHFLLPVCTPAWPLLLTHASARLAPAPQILLAIPVTLIFCGCIYGALSLQGNFAIWWLSYFMVRRFACCAAAVRMGRPIHWALSVQGPSVC